ncbi:MAG: PAS domain-containing protein [Candidatus Omnitrophica bacterium]|nr:PAS domain-containing protein [Candidatus Omnitrophota bacterium]
MERNGIESWESCLQVLPCGALVVDQNGIVEAANPAALTMLSVDAGRLLHQPLLTAIPAWRTTPLAEQWSDGIAPHTANGAVEQIEVQVPQDRWVQVCVSRIPNGTPPQRLLLVLTDITDLVKLRQRLRWTEYQASIGKLARGIAHELNNPLDGVLRYTHLSLEQLREDEPVREYLVHIKEGLDRMVRAVRAFLEFARQATSPISRAVNLNRLIDDALLLVQHRAKFLQIRVMKQLDEQLPEVPDGGLQHALVNLIKNAFDAMPRGGTLTVATRQADGVVEVEVADTGCGIAEEVRPRLFEPFFSTKPIHQGNGLGLIIAKESVERSGGTLSFTSRVGIGTTFTVRIPLAAQEIYPNGTP